MKKMSFVLFLILPLLAISQTPTPIFSIEDELIKVGGSLITPPDKMVADLEFALSKSFDVRVGSEIYTIQTGRYVGWENESGDFDVVKFSRNGQEKLLCRADDGAVRMDDKQNLYSRSFEKYSPKGISLMLS